MEIDIDTSKARFVYLRRDGVAFDYDGLARKAGAEIGKWSEAAIGERTCVFVNLDRVRYVAVLDWPPSRCGKGCVALMKPEAFIARRNRFSKV